MHSYSLIAPAKINLYLEILGDRYDGFHELVMILQSIELADKIHIKPSDAEDIRLHCNHPQVPKDKSNLAYRAAKLICDTFPDVYANYGGIDLTIEKNIPVAAGLAGGSTNAAAVLVGLNLMWQLGLTHPELQDLAAQLGSDIPFCLSGGTAIATGRGEKLDPIRNLNNLWVVLAKYNNLSVSTAWAYQTYRQQYSQSYLSDPEDIKLRRAEVHSSPLVKAIIEQNGVKIGKLLYNDLEKIVLTHHSQVAQVKIAFAELDVLGTMMSGSGPTVFALCESEQKAQQVKQQVEASISDPELSLWVTKLSSGGIQLADDH
ncbi:4-diphosphocytidyl-2-C-methyl-D-erythritol kinase [Stanieria cyanosphaera PCC 7437]|uniref:4-diphosphocytidyl-2-C-methyl-D-erythritol kinase n=1 Tax=Stanieria cyanosphaera (strain ATCC 29371 / PCC 7437) TaxID=111780 RepID=K9XYB1_STAC7|nr:4-(cytidine 5'-diphospho)-2-C-methyl-D-erythritol kinase [Stanieria cyanosphaera]AFZ36647.1 4-diphosphocytidyl-2-C-methyl-D-erythritol kinase [Stanieria cyanosphaera PCC 7437]